MNDADLRAAFTALGLMSDEERRAVLMDIQLSGALGENVTWWEYALSPISEALPAEDAPDGIFDSACAAIDANAAAPSDTETVRSNARDWIQRAPGFWIKPVYQNDQTGQSTTILHIAPGATYDAHHHDTVEELHIISGELSFGDFVLQAGDHHIARPGARHPVARSETGCTAMLIMSASPPSSPALLER